MSYSYSLILTTRLSAEEALFLVCQMPGFEPSEGRVTVGPGIVVDVMTADEEDKEFALKYEGFEPDLRVSLTRNRDNTDGLLQVDNVLRTTMLLLHHCTRNAVLRANDELWLRLYNNALLIDSGGGLVKYYQELLPLITMPYHVVALPDATLESSSIATA